MRKTLFITLLVFASLLFAEEEAAANASASKVLLNPTKEEDAREIVESAKAAENPEVREGGPAPVVATPPATNLPERVSVARDVAIWQKVYLEMETQCVWKAECESIVPGLLTPVLTPVNVTFGPKDFLRLDHEGECAYRVTHSNNVLSVVFPGSEIGDKRILRPFEYAWDDLLGIPIQGSLTNYYTGAFKDGELWRYDFIMLPEAQLRFRQKAATFPYVTIRRHVWFDKVKQRIVKTYRRALNGSETTIIFKVDK
ncbi:hypothetical protein J6T93_03035 [bacterium]|nr:hypothetical protein [bacterium]